VDGDQDRVAPEAPESRGEHLGGADLLDRVADDAEQARRPDTKSASSTVFIGLPSGHAPSRRQPQV
jgi:hypothetical protein